MRLGCLRCVRKHVGSALAVLPELFNGYPKHITLVCGELDQAAQEAIKFSADLADTIRAFRIAVEKTFDLRFTGVPIDRIIMEMPSVEDVLDAIEEAFMLAVANSKQDVKTKGGKLK